MSREYGLFPYMAPDQMPNPNTDGTINSVPTGREIDIDGPAHRAIKPQGRGAVRPGGISATTDVIDTNTTAHTVFTGSF